MPNANKRLYETIWCLAICDLLNCCIVRLFYSLALRLHCGPFSNLNLNWTSDHFSKECFFFPPVVCSTTALIRPIQTHWDSCAYTNAHKLLCVKQWKDINLCRKCDFFTLIIFQSVHRWILDMTASNMDGNEAKKKNVHKTTKFSNGSFSHRSVWFDFVAMWCATQHLPLN